MAQQSVDPDSDGLQAIDTCRLLCELAISAHSRSSSLGAAAVQIAAAACLVRVSVAHIGGARSMLS